MFDGLFGAAVVIVGLTGTVLNIRKNRLCFLVWMGSNASLAVGHLAGHHWPLGLQFATYFGLAVWGWFSWRTEATPSGEDIAAQPQE